MDKTPKNNFELKRRITPGVDLSAGICFFGFFFQNSSFSGKPTTLVALKKNVIKVSVWGTVQSSADGAHLNPDFWLVLKILLLLIFSVKIPQHNQPLHQTELTSAHSVWPPQPRHTHCSHSVTFQLNKRCTKQETVCVMHRDRDFG